MGPYKLVCVVHIVLKVPDAWISECSDSADHFTEVDCSPTLCGPETHIVHS